MDVKLLQSLRNAFTYNITFYHSNTAYSDIFSWMSINLNDNDEFELPIFALAAFNNIGNSLQDIDTLAIKLYSSGINTSYKTLNAAIRVILNADYKQSHLIKIPCKENYITYYGTMGAIFDKNFNPVLLITWKVKYVYNNPINKNERKIRFIEPILRISPEVFIHKNDSVRRYIVNNIVPTTLSLHHINTPYTYRLDDVFETMNHNLNVDAKIIIEKIPFSIKSADAPSISTTNEELLQVVLDNIDDIII